MSKLKTLIYRGNLIESSHEIKCYLGSLRGENIFSTNNENDLIYPRSSIKIFQGIPFSLSKAAEKYSLNKKQIALSCSSHCGEEFHVKELMNWHVANKICKFFSSDSSSGKGIIEVID